MKRFNNSPEMLIVTVGLIFVSIIMLSTLFYTPKLATATVIHSDNQSMSVYEKTDEVIAFDTESAENNNQINENIISETVSQETTPNATTPVETTKENSSYLININTADAETLTTLNGIGPRKAQKIIDYRSSNGNFTSINEIMNVSGIGEKTFEKIKNNITV